MAFRYIRVWAIKQRAQKITIFRAHTGRQSGEKHRLSLADFTTRPHTLNRKHGLAYIEKLVKVKLLCCVLYFSAEAKHGSYPIRV